MARRHFSFTLLSATDVPDVRTFGSMKVYAHVSLRNATAKHQTSVDEVNGTNPKWNTIFKYLIPQSSLEDEKGYSILDVLLYCHRTLGDDKYIGQVNVDLKQLFEGVFSNPEAMAIKVGPDHGTTQGTIEFSYDFGDLDMTVDVKTGKHEKSYVEVIAEQTMMSVITDGVKTVVGAAFGA